MAFRLLVFDYAFIVIKIVIHYRSDAHSHTDPHYRDVPGSGLVLKEGEYETDECRYHSELADRFRSIDLFLFSFSEIDYQSADHHEYLFCGKEDEEEPRQMVESCKTGEDSNGHRLICERVRPFTKSACSVRFAGDISVEDIGHAGEYEYR